MKRKLENIYHKIYDYENLYEAYINARKNKRYRNEVLEFTNNLDENLITIQNELIWKTYKVGEYREFYIHEPKKRLIMALPFRDRVVQWAIHLIVNNFYERTYITHSYACINGRGTHKAVKQMQRWMRQVDRRGDKYYYLKMDVARYFYRIDHCVLIKILEKKIKDEDCVWLLKTIIKSEHEFGLELNYEEDIKIGNKGIPIGNLSSQMMANIYLNELDQFIKRKLGIKYYSRYMDDFIILHEDKEMLNILLKTIKDFLDIKLGLRLNNKTCIRPISMGLEYLGYRIWATHIKLKKKTALKMKRNLKNTKKKFEKGKISFETANSTMESYKGILKKCSGNRLKEKIKEYEIRG